MKEKNYPPIHNPQAANDSDKDSVVDILTDEKFFTQPFSFLFFILPHSGHAQFFGYPTIFSSAPTPAINNDRSLKVQNIFPHNLLMIVRNISYEISSRYIGV